jgi:hypothetical protein
MSPFLPPLDALLTSLGISKNELSSNGKIQINAEALRLLLSQALIATPIDTERYAKQNPDLTQSYKSGDDAGLKHHFVTRGYLEGRDVPYSDFDAEYYATQNTDVAKAYLSGVVKSPLDHYLSTGIHEFRAPKRELEESVAAWAALSKGRKPR